MTAPTLQPVIVGAGPAGIRAAHTLVAHGVRPVVIDEAARGGGQIYRRPPAHFARSAQTLYGTEASRATDLHSTFDSLQAQIDYQPDSLVWNAQGGMLDVLHGPTQTTRTVPYQQLIIARPQLAGMVCFTIVLAILTALRWRKLFWVMMPVTFALWANLHGSFPMGLLLIGCFVAGRAVDRRAPIRQHE